MSWIRTDRGYLASPAEHWIAENYPHNGLFQAYWKNPVFIDNDSQPRQPQVNEYKTAGYTIIYYKEIQDDPGGPEWLGEVTLDPNEEGAGHLRWEWSYENGMRVDGESKGWYPDGRIKFNWTWKDGKLNGPFTSWYSNGNVSEEGYYHNEPHVCSAMRDVLSLEEKIAKVDSEVEKRLHGLCCSYDLYGEIIEKGLYERGKLIEEIK